MLTKPAVFVTVSKYVAITPVRKTAKSTVTIGSTALPKIRPAPSMIQVAAVVDDETISNVDDETISNVDTPQLKGKKRRLDHLSWEEKVQRKKLKNRVAAQTSRDRKKARMEEMDYEIQELTDKTEILVNKCESLQIINDSLLEKNNKLDMEVEQLRQQLQEIQQQQLQQQQQQGKCATCDGCRSLLNGSAVSKNTDPLQQGSNLKDLQSPQDTIVELKEKLKKNATVSSLWRVIALCLLYKMCSNSTKNRSIMLNLMPESWKNLPKASLPISQQIWKQVIERAMRLMPKFHAEQSDCLDQWWGPEQRTWNPANMKTTTMTAA